MPFYRRAYETSSLNGENGLHLFELYIDCSVFLIRHRFPIFLFLIYRRAFTLSRDLFGAVWQFPIYLLRNFEEKWLPRIMYSTYICTTLFYSIAYHVAITQHSRISRQNREKIGKNSKTWIYLSKKVH